MSKKNRKKELEFRIESMEKEVLFLKGSKRTQLIIEYRRLLKSYGKEFGLKEPIYIMRC